MLVGGGQQATAPIVVLEVSCARLAFMHAEDEEKERGCTQVLTAGDDS